MDDRMGKVEIEKFLMILNDRLKKENVTGEVVLFGGAVMCLVFDSREQTRDIDAVYYPKEVINRIIHEMAKEYALSENWFNDSVKGFMSSEYDLEKVKDYGNLVVYSPSAEYIFAMKCYACRRVRLSCRDGIGPVDPFAGALWHGRKRLEVLSS